MGFQALKIFLEKEFQKYLDEEKLRVVCWMHSDDDFEKLEKKLKMLVPESPRLIRHIGHCALDIIPTSGIFLSRY